MRRTTGTTLLEQARLFSHLLTHSPDPTLRHHAAEIERFLTLLRERAVITHSVHAEFRGPAFPHPGLLLSDGSADDLPGRVALARQRLLALCDALVERKIKLALAPPP